MTKTTRERPPTKEQKKFLKWLTRGGFIKVFKKLAKE